MKDWKKKIAPGMSRALPILKRLSMWLRQNYQGPALRAPLPFMGRGDKFYVLIASPEGLLVAEYNVKGEREQVWLVEDFLERYAPAAKSKNAKRALASFDALLAEHVFRG